MAGGGAGNPLEDGWAGRVSWRPAPERRLSGNSTRWKVGWFEAVDRNRVRSVADLELKGEWRAAKDLERARIGRGEGGWAGGGGRE